MIVFINTILVLSKNERGDEENLRMALETFLGYKLYTKYSKCHFREREKWSFLALRKMVKVLL